MRAAGWMDAARDLPSDIADELECGQYRSFGALGLRAGQTRIEATRRSQLLRFQSIVLPASTSCCLLKDSGSTHSSNDES
jgi:hypothetical protein